MRAGVGRWWVGVWVGLLGVAGSDPAPYRVQHWHADHGLPQNTVQALHQTRDGYVWVGTRFGLARFDGVRFHAVPVPPEDSGVADSISALAEDGEGTLWVGTLRGLFRLAGGRLERVPEPASERIWALWPEGAGILWMGLGHGLGRLEAGRIEVFKVSETAAEANQVRALAPLDSGSLLVTTLGGAFRFDLPRRTFASWQFPSPATGVRPGPEPPDPSRSRDAPSSPPAILQAFAREALGLRTVHPSRNDWGPRISADGPGAWWVLGGRRRLHRVDAAGVEPWPPGFEGSPEEILCVLRDREGGVWLGTVASGVLRLRPPLFQTLALGVGEEAGVFTVAGDPEGNLWAATRSVLSRISASHRETFPLTGGERARQVTSLLPDGNGVWLGRDRGGLWRWEAGRMTDWSSSLGLSPMARVRALYRSRDHSLWIGLRRGLLRSGPGGLDVVAPEDGPDAPDVGAIHEDSAGRIWVGTDGQGVRRLDPGGWQRIGADSGLGMPTVWGFHTDRTGALWLLGTGGITRFQDGRFQTVTRDSGLYDDVNNQMFEDATGHFWIGCNRGIYRLTTNELHAAASGRGRVNSVVFGVADGLAVAETNGENQPAGWHDTSGVLWFPSPAGVVRVDPGQVAANEVPPTVVLESVRTESLRVWDEAGGNPVLQRSPGGLRLPPGSARVLEFHYTANSFSAPERVRFRHRLLGSETNWVEAGNRRVAYYTHLRPGTYRFEVTACNNHGVWAPVPTSLGLRIEPHWYQTPAFHVTAAALGMALIWALHRIRVRILQRRLALEGQLELAQERERIARDMHDDIGAGLTQIGLLTQRAARTPPAETPRILERIAGASREAARAMDQIVWAVNPRNDRLEPLVDYLCQVAREYLEPTGIRCRFDVPPLLPDAVVSSDVRHHLLLLIKESLNNVVRHSGAGQVNLGVRFDAGVLHLTLEDNGRGLPEAGTASIRTRGGNGLGNLRDRLEALGGRFSLESAAGSGTRVRAEVPLQPRDPGSRRATRT